MFQSVVRSFLRDLHIVNMRFTPAGRCDFNKAGFAAHLINRTAAAVAHRRTKAAAHLIDDGKNASFVGNHTFNTFRYKLINIAVIVVLEVTVGRAFVHSAERAHTAVALVGAALIQNDFARSFVSTGKHTAHHDGIGTGCDGFCDVAGEADTAVSDQRNTGALKSFGNVRDGSNLRNTDTGNNASRTNRTRADADFNSVCTVFNEGQSSSGSSNVSANNLNLRIVLR